MNNGNLANKLPTPLKENYLAALRYWREILGPQYVVTESDSLYLYGRTCGTKDVFPPAIIRPGSQEQVIESVKIAGRFSVPIYPVSCGKNWGYGSATASSEGNVILDLSRLNKIIELNPELAYAVVEPGVTQQQLYEYLESNNIPLTFDVTGSSKGASLLGNLVERGSGPTKYADHFLNSSGMEVVLGDGTLLRTGFGHIDGAKSTHLYKWGFGPYLDGIFTQSNFGIVTKVGIWLMPKPRNFTLVLGSIDSDLRLAESIDRLRMLKLRGVLPGAIHIANDLRVISVLQNFPFEEATSSYCLSDAERKLLQRKWNVSEWNILASLEGSKAQIRANLKEIHRELKGKIKIQSFSERLLSLCSKSKFLQKLSGQRDLKTKLSILRLMKGLPSDTALKGVYWRKQNVPVDPTKLIEDRCGVMWASPIVPMTNKDVSLFLSLTRKICAKHEIDTNVSVTLLTERACCCTVGIIFNRDNQEESDRAMKCYTTLVKKYVENGYPPYRLNSDISKTREFLIKKDDTFFEVNRRIKTVLDPHGIIAPDRYGVS